MDCLLHILSGCAECSSEKGMRYNHLNGMLCAPGMRSGTCFLVLLGWLCLIRVDCVWAILPV